MATGYFLLTDITGYTIYLTQSELEHAQDVLNTLFEALLERFQPPLQVSNFQGDAILAYAPEGSFVQGQTLLEMAENIYYAFTDVREKMHYNTTCECNACRNISGLDLKIFIHYGQYILQKMGPRQELMGPDVILAHRLMKNDVRETTGIKAYALITAAAAQALHLDPVQLGMRPYRAAYEHLGEVQTVVHDLRACFEHWRAARRLQVTPDTAQTLVTVELPVAMPLAWDYLTRPDLKRLWLQMDNVIRQDRADGRAGEGSQYHCAHNAGDLRYTVKDWHPFNYFTVEGVGVLGENFRVTFLLEPLATGARFSWLCEYLDDKRLQAKAIYDMSMSGALVNLRSLIEADLSAGKIHVTSE